MAKRKLTNVRSNLEHWISVAECFEKYGDCPMFRNDLQKAAFMSRVILRKHGESKSRKDLRVGE